MDEQDSLLRAVPARDQNTVNPVNTAVTHESQKASLLQRRCGPELEAQQSESGNAHIQQACTQTADQPTQPLHQLQQGAHGFTASTASVTGVDQQPAQLQRSQKSNQGVRATAKQKQKQRKHTPKTKAPVQNRSKRPQRDTAVWQQL
ncbi:hypothetical protein V7S43_002538 [Phytophthora oleae]|uniref:Uncharacterized protein n=1 Tax=Phytophthora oleae TaxID=2107226 RepID=A0ABD3G1M5_9STRA